MKLKAEKLFVWQLRKIINEVNKVGRIFVKYSEENNQQMRCGIWRLKYSGKLLWVCGCPESRKCMDIIQMGSDSATTMKEIIKRCIKELIGMQYSYVVTTENVKDKSTVDCIMYSATGELYYYCWNKKNVIKEINEQKYERYEMLLKNGYWNVFNSPVTYINMRYITEKLIFTQKCVQYDKKKYLYILDGYKRYLSESIKIGEIELGSLLGQYYIELPHMENIFPRKILKTKINLYYMHGDMWTDNVLQDIDGKYYVIDYDHAGVYPFFFDILEYIWAVYVNDGRMIFWTEICNEKNEMGQIYNEILLEQGVDTSYDTKSALMVLMGMIRFQVYNHRFEESDGTENKNYKHNHYKLLIKFIQSIRMTDEDI